MKAKWDDLTNTEKYILDIIIQNMEKIKKYNMEELAKFTNSSLGSISRLYNKLGYDSYKVFKNEFYSFKKIKKEISINELKINEIIEKNKREINLTISYLEIEFIKNLPKKCTIQIEYLFMAKDFLHLFVNMQLENYKLLEKMHFHFMMMR